MSYCSATARIGPWKIGSTVTSVTRRPSRKTHGAFFLSDSTYSAPLRAGMWAVPPGCGRCRAAPCASRRGARPPDAEVSGPEERLVAPDRHAVTVAPRRVIVPHRVMLDAAVVPEGDRARLPAEAAVELRRLHVAEQHLEHRLALRARELDDPRGESPIHEQRASPRDGMRADHGMLRPRKHLALVLDPVAAAVHVLAVVDRGAVLEQALHRLGQRVVRGVHAGEQRVPTHRRQLVHAEDAAHGRLGIAGDVGMPFLARDALRVLVGVDDEDLRVALHEPWRRRMHMQLPEAAAESLVLFGREVLIAEEDHLVLGELVPDLGERLLVERLREVDAGQLGTDVARELLGLDRAMSHGRILRRRAGAARNSVGPA